MMYKPKILFQSNYHGQLTGFGKNTKNVLYYLAKTDQYELVELANGYRYSDPKLLQSPWKCVGGLPDDPRETENWIKSHPPDKIEWAKKRAFYGDILIDQILESEKPDVYIYAEDVWASAQYAQKPWWNKFPCFVWTTLDSLPLLPDAINLAKTTPHYYVWADFARQELHKIGLKHVKTIHGSLKTSDFFPLESSKRLELRNSQNIGNKDYVIGFVFRNQLRKSVAVLLDSVAQFKIKNPSTKTKILLVTNFSEGWPILKLAQEYGVESDVVTPYVCHKCSKYHISEYTGETKECPNCSSKDSCKTVNIEKGLTESQLNEIYNIMDVYAHPFTSGGQEIPLQEAKLTELITLATNYSCGTDCCGEESGGLPISWHEYREFGSTFKKAATDSKDLCNQLDKVFKMSPEERKTMGKVARQYVLDNYSQEAVGKRLEEEINSSKRTNYWKSFKKYTLNSSFVPDSKLDNQNWLLSLYHNMMGQEVLDDNFPVALNALNNGETRENVLCQFRAEAIKRENKNPSVKPANDIDYYPLTTSRYITIVSQNSSSYPMWLEVTKHLAPIRQLGVDILLFDESRKIVSPYCISVNDATPSQIKYINENSIRFYGFEDLKDANYFKLQKTSSGSLCDFNQSEMASIDPIYIANQILKSFGLKRINKSLVYYGTFSDKKIVEVIPNFVVQNKYDGHTILRLDKGGDWNNAKHLKWNSVITKTSQNIAEIYRSCDKVYIAVNNISLSEISEYINSKTVLVCDDKNLLKQKRLEYIDYTVLELSKTKKGHLIDKDLSNCFVQSDRVVVSEGIQYNSFAHEKNRLTFSQEFAILDCEEFWESQDFYKIFKPI